MVCEVLMCCRLKLERDMNSTYGFIFLWCPLPLKRENRDVHHLLSTICTEKQKTNIEFSTSNAKCVCICVVEMWEGSLRNVGEKENWHVLYEGLLKTSYHSHQPQLKMGRRCFKLCSTFHESLSQRLTGPGVIWGMWWHVPDFWADVFIDI